MASEPQTLSFTLVVEQRGGQVLYKALRDQLKKCVEAFPMLRFVSINETIIPDRFLLSDPDKIPPDFK